MSAGADRREAPDVAVLGGGMMGLTAARALARSGHRVTLYEAAPAAGGVSAACDLGGFTVDRFYHTILPSDTALLGLLAELGLDGEVAWRVTRTGFAQAGRHHSVSNVAEFLRFPVLTPAERLRLGWALWRAQHGVDWPDVAHLTCEQWLARACGEGVVRKLWRPLLRAKLGAAAPRVSASFIWATINRLQDAKRGAGAARSDRMGFLRGSYRVLLDALLSDLARRGARVVVDAAVTGLAPAPGGGWLVTTAAGPFTHDTVVSTLPPAVLARALRDDALGPDTAAARARLAGVEYLGVAVEVLLLKRPLGPFYILNLGDDDLPLTGVIETTNLAPVGYFGEKSLVYLPRYLAPGDPWAGRDEGAVVGGFHAALARVHPGFRPELIAARALQRAPFVQPIHTLGYAEEKLPPEELAPGLYCASTAQIHPWPLANNAVVRQALAVAEQVAAATAAAADRPDGETAA